MLTNLLVKKVNRKQYVLQQLKGCVMAFSYYQLHPNNKLCIRIRRTTDDALLDVGFRNGRIDYESIHAFLGGTISAGIAIWYNQSRVVGATDAVQTVSIQQPLWSYSVNPLNGISFDGVATWLTISNYAELDILASPLSMYYDIYKADQADAKYLFTRNTSSPSDMQYGTYVDSTAPNNIIAVNLNGSFRYSLNMKAPQSKAWIRWQDTVIYGNSENARSTLAFTSTLASATYTQIGCRATLGGLPAVFYNAQLKTLMLFNSKLSERAIETTKGLI